MQGRRRRIVCSGDVGCNVTPASPSSSRARSRLAYAVATVGSWVAAGVISLSWRGHLGEFVSAGSGRRYDAGGGDVYSKHRASRETWAPNVEHPQTTSTPVNAMLGASSALGGAAVLVGVAVSVAAARQTSARPVVGRVGSQRSSRRSSTLAQEADSDDGGIFDFLSDFTASARRAASGLLQPRAEDTRQKAPKPQNTSWFDQFSNGSTGESSKRKAPAPEQSSQPDWFRNPFETPATAPVVAPVAEQSWLDDAVSAFQGAVDGGQVREAPPPPKKNESEEFLEDLGAKFTAPFTAPVYAAVDATNVAMRRAEEAVEGVLAIPGIIKMNLVDRPVRAATGFGEAVSNTAQVVKETVPVIFTATVEAPGNIARTIDEAPANISKTINEVEQTIESIIDAPNRAKRSIENTIENVQQTVDTTREFMSHVANAGGAVVKGAQDLIEASQQTRLKADGHGAMGSESDASLNAFSENIAERTLIDEAKMPVLEDEEKPAYMEGYSSLPMRPISVVPARPRAGPAASSRPAFQSARPAAAAAKNKGILTDDAEAQKAVREKMMHEVRELRMTGQARTDEEALQMYCERLSAKVAEEGFQAQLERNAVVCAQLEREVSHLRRTIMDEDEQKHYENAAGLRLQLMVTETRLKAALHEKTTTSNQQTELFSQFRQRLMQDGADIWEPQPIA